jgi:AcrR family transcriptional regulator
MATTQPTARNRERTRRRLIDTTIELVREKGFRAIGINAIAHRAGLSKVLIYRYFGDLSGLLESVADVLDLTNTQMIQAALFSPDDEVPFRNRVRDALMSFHDRVSADTLAMELMVQELQEENELTRVLADARERQGLEATTRISQAFGAQAQAPDNAPGVDMNALLALASAGIYYLSLRARTVKMYNGIDIQSRDGWYRMCDTLATLMDNVRPAGGESLARESAPRESSDRGPSGA